MINKFLSRYFIVNQREQSEKIVPYSQFMTNPNWSLAFISFERLPKYKTWKLHNEIKSTATLHSLSSAFFFFLLINRTRWKSIRNCIERSKVWPEQQSKNKFVKKKSREKWWKGKKICALVPKKLLYIFTLMLFLETVIIQFRSKWTAQRSV